MTNAHTPIFEYQSSAEYNDDAFSAAFLGQQSYIELLRIADSYFNLNMTTKNRKLPCQQNSYMVMVRSPSDPQHLWRGVGKKISLTVDSILYNSQYGVLVALVRMKHNFTCNKHPHIVLAKRQGVNNVLVSRVVNDMLSESHVEQLYSPHRVHGKIGVIFGSGEELIKPDTKIVDGIEIRTTHNVVTRPEVVYTVEQPLPPSTSNSKFVSFDQFRRMSQSQGQSQCSDSGSDIMEITLENTKGDHLTGELYQGEPVMKGPRGGKFIMKDGKKKYVTSSGGSGSKEGKSSSDVVYNINILE